MTSNQINFYYFKLNTFLNRFFVSSWFYVDLNRIIFCYLGWFEFERTFCFAIMLLNKDPLEFKMLRTQLKILVIHSEKPGYVDLVIIDINAVC